MNKATDYNWKLALKVKDGHRYFYSTHEDTEGDPRIACADDSGRTPDQTEDGVLWVDRARPIRLRLSGATIPLLSERGERTKEQESWTGETLLGGLLVAMTFGLEIDPSDDVRELVASVNKLALEGRVSR